jgi:endonuclease YncB( thermonuclease family)
MVIYPPQQAPVIINQFGSGDGQYVTRVQPQNIYPQQQTRPQAEDPASAAETSHYLIAFKDHSIYSAVAYWVDGDTLHYFTTGSTHNQASVSLVDRELTDRLNRDSGVEVKLPPAK